MTKLCSHVLFWGLKDICKEYSICFYFSWQKSYFLAFFQKHNEPLAQNRRTYQTLNFVYRNFVRFYTHPCTLNCKSHVFVSASLLFWVCTCLLSSSKFCFLSFSSSALSGYLSSSFHVSTFLQTSFNNLTRQSCSLFNLKPSSKSSEIFSKYSVWNRETGWKCKVFLRGYRRTGLAHSLHHWYVLVADTHAE